MPEWLWTIAQPHSILSLVAIWIALGVFLRFSALFPGVESALTHNGQETAVQATVRPRRDLLRLQKFSLSARQVWLAVGGALGVFLPLPWIILPWAEGQGRELGTGWMLFGAAPSAVFLVAGLTTAYVGVMNLKAAYVRATPQERQQLGWLFFGVTGAFWFSLVGIGVWFLLPPEPVLAHQALLFLLPGLSATSFKMLHSSSLDSQEASGPS